MSNKGELSWSWIPKNYSQVQKTKENFVMACLHPPLNVDFAKQRKQRTRPILLSPFRTKERRRDVLHALFLEKLGKNGEKKYRAMFVY